MPERAESEREAWLCIARIFQSEETANQFLEAATSQGLTPRQLSILFQIQPDKPQTMATLADRCHSTPSYMSNVVDTLVERGLADRRIPSDDRRRKLVVRTPAGEEAIGGALEVLSQPPAGFEVLTDNQVGQLKDLLTKVAARYKWSF